MDSDILRWSEIGAEVERRPRGMRARLARELEMDRSQLARTLRSKGYPRADQARVVARVLADQPAETPPVVRTPEGTIMRVPMYGYAAGSEGDRIALNDGEILDWVDLPMGMSVRGDFFVIQTYGSSMEPRIWAGERKLVQRRVPPARDQDCVIEFNDGTGVVKTYKRERDGHIFAAQYNPERELSFPSTSVKALHAIFPL